MDGVMSASGIAHSYIDSVKDDLLKKIVREFSVKKSGENFYTPQVLICKLGKCNLAGYSVYQIKNELIANGYLTNITLQNSSYMVPSGFSLTAKAFAIRDQLTTQEHSVHPVIPPLPVLTAQDVIDFFTEHNILSHTI